MSLAFTIPDIVSSSQTRNLNVKFLHDQKRPTGRISVKDALASEKPLRLYAEYVSSGGGSYRVVVHYCESDIWSVGELGFALTLFTEELSQEFAVAWAFYGLYVRKSVRGWGRCKSVRKRLLPVSFKRAYFESSTICYWNKEDTPADDNEDMYVGDILSRLLNKTIRLNRKFDTKYVDPADVKPTYERPECWIRNSEVDDTVYDLFVQFANLSLNPGTGLAGHNSGQYFGVQFAEIKKIFDNFKTIDYRDIHGAYGYGLMFKGARKNGVLRNVFPMTPKLNGYINQTFGPQKPAFPAWIRNVEGCNFKPFKHSYDLKGCDKRVLPYFQRLIREKHPDAYDKIFSKVNFLGGEYDLPQFPSGICCFMQSIPVAFTAAIVASKFPNSPFQIQGDGVACDFVIDDDRFEEFPKDVINGFVYDGGPPRYFNGPKRLSTPILLGENRLYHGSVLWEFRWNIYKRFLRADNLPPCPDLHGFSGLTNRELWDRIDYDSHLRHVTSKLLGTGEEGHRSCCTWTANDAYGHF